MSEAELNDEDWIDAAWKKDDLRCRWQMDFDKEQVPQPVSNHENWNQILKQFPRIRTPRPDISWGIFKTAFTLYQAHFLINNGANLVGNDIYNIFFTSEAKSINGSIEEAENQCLRSGATTVENRRKLIAAAREQPVPASLFPSIQYPRVDTESFAFSLAVTPNIANMFVHWCLEVDAGYVHWHAHRLEGYRFDRADEIAQLHHDIDNGLDWGVGTRKRDTIKLADRIIELGKVVAQPSPPKKQKPNQG